MTNSILDSIIDNKMCVGCGICAGLDHGIRMEYNTEGYLRPFKSDKLLEETEEIIKKVCPALVVDYSVLDEKTAHSDVLWGKYNEATIAYSTDPEIRFKSSSGGVLSGLLIYLLETNKVDGVIHTGTSDEKPLENCVVKSYTKEDIIKNSGSRYSPSSPLSTLFEIINDDKTYAFVGKPCDVAALQMLIKQKPKLNNKFAYKLSFFCAGTPSQKGTNEILSVFSVKEHYVREFRYRGEGWPGTTKVKTLNNEEYSMTYEESWGSILNQYLQPRCKVCIDGTGEFADISCGDGWIDSHDGYPDFSESEGRSLLLTRTSKGSKLLSEAIEMGYIVSNGYVASAQIEKIQPYQAKRRKLLLSRLLALKTLNRKIPKYPKNIVTKASKQLAIKTQVKSYLGTLKRVAKGRL